MHRFSHWLGLALITAAAGWPHIAAPADEPLEEGLVTAAYLGGGADDAPQSITVLDAATLQGAGVQHLEDVLSLVPDLNWAAGTNRPRFFQLRGIGEVEQYQGAPNPSVGFLIDDIDFSGVGSPATLFDVFNPATGATVARASRAESPCPPAYLSSDASSSSRRACISFESPATHPRSGAGPAPASR